MAGGKRKRNAFHGCHEHVASCLAMEQHGIRKRFSNVDVMNHVVSCLPARIQERQYTLQETNKLFAMQWIDNNQVLVGSKCNKLLLLDISHHKKLQYRNIPMPPAPPRSFGLNVHGWGECGIHCIALNPCGDLIATGGSNPADCLILRTSDWSPVATLIGHRDWLFGAAWVTDRHVVTGSRDQSTALWTIADEEVNNTCGPPSVQEYDYNNRMCMKRKYQGKVREVKYDHSLGLVAALANNGFVVLQDPGMDLRVVRRLNVITNQDLVAMALRRDIVASAGLNIVSMSDPRRREPFAFIEGIHSPDGPCGIRSVCFHNNFLSFGTGLGKIAFWDLRMRKFLPTNLSMCSRSREEMTEESPSSTTHSEPSRSETSWQPAESPDGFFRPATHASDVAIDYFGDLHGSSGRQQQEAADTPAGVRRYPTPKVGQYLQLGKGWIGRDPDSLYYLDRFGNLEGQACYAHGWDATGTRLFAVGGPLSFGLSGGYIGLFE